MKCKSKIAAFAAVITATVLTVGVANAGGSIKTAVTTAQGVDPVLNLSTTLIKNSVSLIENNNMVKIGGVCCFMNPVNAGKAAVEATAAGLLIGVDAGLHR
jgi:hypothetical protein